jgi:hypothetical protein
MICNCIKTHVCLWQCLAELFLKLEMFETKILEKIKTQILRSMPFP